MKIFRVLTFLLLLVFYSGIAPPVLAAIDNSGTLNRAGAGIYESQLPLTLPQIIGAGIKILLQSLGIVLLVIIIYAGILWMTAGGDIKQVDKAKSWMTNAITGLLISLAAYAIATYVVDKLMFATS